MCISTLPPLEPSVHRIGVLGGAFDPVHVGHLWLAQEAVRSASLDVLFFVPCRVPPHKPCCLASDADRLAMLRLATSRQEAFRVTDVEITQEGPSYSVRTLRSMREAWGENRWIGFILGGDAISEIHLWREASEFVRLCDNILVAPRPGRDLSCQLEAAKERILYLPEVPFRISSTWIRQRVADGLSLRYLVHDDVAAYILAKELYHP